MKYAIWRLKHLHAAYIIVRRGRTAWCIRCNGTFNLNH